MSQKLSDSEIKTQLADLSGWALENGEITRTFEMASFPAAVLFVSAVGLLAEAVEHHPDMLIKYRKVRLALVTHDAGGITDKDFSLAKQINTLPI
jgi:4a-hydroxytetrahydrobiopterin dehydratase